MSNQERSVKNSSPGKAKAMVTVKILKHVLEEEGIYKRGGEVELPTGNSKSLTVSLRQKNNVKKKAPTFNIKSMTKLQTTCNLSDRTVM